MKHEAPSAWPSAPGATLSEKTAAKEFGLSHDEIVSAIRAGKLRHVVNYAHGNPYIKLIRKEVEALVRSMRGAGDIETSKLNVELAKVTTELRSLKRKVVVLEKRKAELETTLGRGRP
jgi:septal ring factor EnvC (AmiA/AmiB activator)